MKSEEYKEQVEALTKDFILNGEGEMNDKMAAVMVSTIILLARSIATTGYVNGGDAKAVDVLRAKAIICLDNSLDGHKKQFKTLDMLLGMMKKPASPTSDGDAILDHVTNPNADLDTEMRKFNEDHPFTPPTPESAT